MTLIEVMIVIAVITVVAAVASPAFTEAVRTNRIDIATLETQRAIELARSEAIKRAQLVIVEPVTAGDWTSGLRVYADAARNPTDAITGADTLIRQTNALKGVTVTASGAAPRLAFDPRGQNVSLVAVNPAPMQRTFAVCKSPVRRVLVVEPNGYMTHTTSGSC